MRLLEVILRVGVAIRTIARRCQDEIGTKASALTIQRIVGGAARNCKTTIEVAEEFKPSWSGWLLVDGKVIKVKGKRYSLLIAVDRNRDIVHVLFAEGEGKESWKRFLVEIKGEIGYRLKGIVSDMDDDLDWAINEVWPEKPHQYCIKHMLARVDELTNYRSIRRQIMKLRDRLKDLEWKVGVKGKWGDPKRYQKLVVVKESIKKLVRKYKLELSLRVIARQFLLAESLEDALKAYDRIWEDRKKYKKKDLENLIESLRDHKDGLLAHFRYPGLPRTNNIVENTNKQINRRLKTIEGFKRRETAKNYLNLLIMYLRFKPFTDCRKKNKWMNGKSRLQIAGINTRGLDWMRFSQRKRILKTHI